MAPNVGNVKQLVSGNTLKRKRCNENSGNASTPVREGKKKMVSALEDQLFNPDLHYMQPEERLLFEQPKMQNVIDLDYLDTLPEMQSKWDYPIENSKCMARVQKRQYRVAVQCIGKQTHGDLCKRHSYGELFYGRIDRDPPQDKLTMLEQLCEAEASKQLNAMKTGYRRNGLQFIALPRKHRIGDKTLVWADKRDAQEGIRVDGVCCRIGDFVCVQPDNSKRINYGVNYLIARIMSLSFADNKRSSGQVQVRWYINPQDNVLFRHRVEDRYFEQQEIIETLNVGTIAVECILRKLNVFMGAADEFHGGQAAMIHSSTAFFCQRRFDPETYDFDYCANDNQPEAADEKELSVILRARAALQMFNIPDNLVGRENHLKQVSGFINAVIDAESDTNFFLIYGVPGTGKTAVVDLALRKANVRSVRVNGMKMESVKQIWEEVAVQLALVSRSASNKAAQKLTAYFEENEEPLIIMVDEIDAITSKWGKSQYDLFDWPVQYQNVAVIAISNSMDLPERLPRRLASRMRFKPLGFQPYDLYEITNILKHRLKDLPDTFDDRALHLVSSRVGSVEGDIRRALKICNLALQMLMQSGQPPPVKAIHIEQADEKFRRMENFQLSAINELLDPITKSLLIALLQDLRIRKANMSTMTYLRSQFMTLASRHWRLIDPDLPDFESITGYEWSDIISSSVNLLVKHSFLEKIEEGPRRARLLHETTGKVLCKHTPFDFDSLSVLVLNFHTTDVIQYLKNVLRDPLASQVLMD